MYLLFHYINLCILFLHFIFYLSHEYNLSHFHEYKTADKTIAIKLRLKVDIANNNAKKGKAAVKRNFVHLNTFDQEMAEN